MATAVIGAGKIGRAVARNLVTGGERVVIGEGRSSAAADLAGELGDLASSAVVPEAIAQADAVVLAVWLDAERQVVAENADALSGKVVIDPSNPIAFDAEGNLSRTLPDGVSSGSVIADLLPDGAHFAKAFGTLSGDSLAVAANRSPRVVLLFATDDDDARAEVERLIGASGFDPVQAGGVADSGRIEVGGDLHELSRDGELLDADSARLAVAQQP